MDDSAVVLLILTIGPVILAENSGPPRYVFEGFLHNPIDGATYQAKMSQGWAKVSGNRRRPIVGTRTGAYPYVFYLLLGHVARSSPQSCGESRSSAEKSLWDLAISLSLFCGAE